MGADIAIILGSGLNELEQEAPAESAISYSEFSELPRTSVRGHGGRFALKQMHSWMMIADHINLTDATPLLGRAEFVDMTEPYSKQGPQYETPAEVRMLR
jgi:purine nucleoside phosphorylase